MVRRKKIGQVRNRRLKPRLPTPRSRDLEKIQRPKGVTDPRTQQLLLPDPLCKPSRHKYPPVTFRNHSPSTPDPDSPTGRTTPEDFRSYNPERNETTWWLLGTTGTRGSATLKEPPLKKGRRGGETGKERNAEGRDRNPKSRTNVW